MKLDLITNSYKKYNEDGFGTTKNAFWVSDGASALNENNFTNEENDVYWVVNWWNKYLEANIEFNDKSIAEIVEEGIYQLNIEFSKFISVSSLSKLDVVSLGMAIVRINNDELEHFVLGDVEVNIKNKIGEFSSFTDRIIKERDQQIIDLMASDKQRENNIIFKGFTQKELKLLQKNRSEMNTNQGYYILEHDPTAVKKAIQGKEKLSNIDEIMIFSDGFAQLYNNHSLPEIFKLSKAKGLEQTVLELREREILDNKMINYQRLKKHDDVTVISIIL